MDDLNGLDWSAPQPNKQPSNPSPAFPPFRQNPTPQLSGRSTPLSLSAQQSGAGAPNRALKPSSKPTTPANDSFASLITSKSNKPANANLSLQERQKQLQQEKQRQEEERRKQYDSHFGGSDSKFWDNLGSGKSTPEPAASGILAPPSNVTGGSSLSKTINKPFAGLDTTAKRPVQASPVNDDILSAFNSAAPVDKSSHFPPPSGAFGSGRSTPATGAQSSRGHTPVPQSSTSAAFDDDDIFGLNQMSQKPVSASTPQATSAAEGDDDILGLLGKPVSEFERKPEPEPEPVARDPPRRQAREPSPDLDNPQAKAVAELVDMGFPADKSAIALANTESGLDVQAAVSWLLNQAHADAKQKTQQGRREERPRHSPDEFDERPRKGPGRSSTRDSSTGGSQPAWMRGEDSRSRSSHRRQEGQSANQEKDVAQYASDIGNSLFKSANSLWKTGRKQVQKAVADFQQDGDPNVPKWMREAQGQSSGGNRAGKTPLQDATDEAMMLEGGGRPQKPSRPSESRHHQDPLALRHREDPRNPFPDRQASRSPAFRQPSPAVDKRPAARLTRQEVEESTAQAYVSPARRKKATPQPDLFSTEQPAPSQPSSRQSTPSQSNNPFMKAASSTPKSRSPAATPPIAPRPKAPPRRVPPASSSALNSSTSYRQKGSEAFKRGDYAEAHTAYTSALGPLPGDHPVAIIVLCNRAVTNIKVGDPKAAISDADAALAIIGISKGEGERIALGGTEGEKDMREFYGKALMRKAEALENMEKWSDAGKVWREAVEAGVGGSISIQGRNRCEKVNSSSSSSASSQPAKRAPPARKPATPKPASSALSSLAAPSAADSEAVKRLQAANAAASRADDEKFALTDQVDAKLVAWKGTKADNLRALLGSLDRVLWPEAGWKKVGMGDLVMANKVKIVYMKAIAKVHPDKIPQDATTEQRMISAAVFATLNEAWDKFKTDNGL
ncbi:hypothetical protein BU24DRAFT_438508 [Aaosphaeria arxii CBS 175.79]|uniref:UBA domain-containing protein n=1 Tax=Aaosphaeria arxii CBS 175.79 TaxID=1450172 RepID=A0A6A5Y9B2_9PLEO|nr:uncharacterized protein BU24DRAFT_438508 [Aaosphaeria arxii CBS 175.79]KAF2021400.1 hypothetical protein BU24DRAFT_438508 [Aaosphaeria arxii CBS 175.79]